MDPVTVLQLLAAGPVAPETTYRVVAVRGEKTRALGQVDADHVEQFVAAERAALRGWRIDVRAETYPRRVTGGDLAGSSPVTTNLEKRS